MYQHDQCNVSNKPRTEIMTLLMTLTQLVKVKPMQSLLKNHVTCRNSQIYKKILLTN